MTTKGYLSKILLLIIMVFFSFFAITCSGGGGGSENALSSNKEITAFSFTAASNSGILSSDVKSTINNTSITAEVPYGTNVTSLVATFSTTGKSVEIGSTTQISGTTANNFTNIVTYTVTAEDGSKKSYAVTVYISKIVGKTDAIAFESHKVEINGNYAYLADSNGLKIIDISNPANPVIVSTSGGSYYDVSVSGSYAYIVAGFDGLKIVNISDPANPVLTSTVDLNMDMGLRWAYGVAVSGNYAYIADEGEGLKIVNISDPANPSLTGYFYTFDARGVALSGNYAYIADGADGLKIIDISDPAHPSLAGTLDTNYAYEVAVSGSYAYMADYASGWLCCINNFMYYGHIIFK